MQATLFDDINPSKNTGLNIRGGAKKLLSKNQLAFNKLTQKIEQLNKEIERKKLQFDAALKMYAAELYPAQLKALEARNKLIVTLWEIYRSKKLSKANQRQLKQVLLFHLGESLEQHTAEPSQALQDIFSALNGISYNDAKKAEAEMMADQVKAHFARMKIDIDGLDLEDEAAMASKLAELGQQIEMEEAEYEEKKIGEKQKKRNRINRRNTKNCNKLFKMPSKKILAVFTVNWPKYFILTWSRMQKRKWLRKY